MAFDFRMHFQLFKHINLANGMKKTIFLTIYLFTILIFTYQNAQISAYKMYYFDQIGSSFKYKCVSNIRPVYSNVFESRLLTRLYEIRSQTYTRHQFNDDESGLILDDWDHIIDALKLFRQINGDMFVSQKFDVPGTHPWPSHVHGLRLGKRLEKILSSKVFFEMHEDKVQELQKIGFYPSVDSLVSDWKIIYDALKVYLSVYGNIRVPAKFQIPDEEPWPRYCRNVKLGVRVAAIRSAGRYVKDHPERKVDLDKLGFEWRLRDNNYQQQLGEDLFEQIYEALVIYKKEFGNITVRTDFTVPAQSPWSESSYGLPLGNYVQAIRDKDKMVFGNADREKRLTDLGFEWEESARAEFSKRRFSIVYSALQRYKEEYGDLMVPQAFAVPEDDVSWPVETRGLKLGARVNAIRCQGTLVANSPDRR